MILGNHSSRGVLSSCDALAVGPVVTRNRRLRRPAPLEEKARQCPLHSWRGYLLSSLQTNAECLARPVPPHGGPASLPRGTCLCRACVALLLLGGAREISLAGRRHCSSPSPLAWGRGDGNLLCTLGRWPLGGPPRTNQTPPPDTPSIYICIYVLYQS